MSSSSTSVPGPSWDQGSLVARSLEVEPGKEVKYTMMHQIGSGAGGNVYKCMNLKGEVMAVKKVKHHKSDVTFRIMREVRIHRSVEHPNIVKIFHYQYDFESGILEIFLALKKGSVSSLLRNESPLRLTIPKDFEFVAKCLKQMLQAIDYLATENVSHRDIKPENIMYVMDSDSRPFFQLGDFGFAHDFSSGENPERWRVGTKGYMAPELEHVEQFGIEKKQVHKMDVWSLFMTVMWIVDAEHFRNMSRYPLTFADYYDFATNAAKSTLRRYSMMVKWRPEDRASAAQMLVHLYDGEGLSTPRDQIPAIDFP